MAKNDIPRPRASERMWLDAALDLLLEAGVDGVKILPLAKRLGLTRTGFYHHFRDREALLDAMIKRWEDKNTGNLVANARFMPRRSVRRCSTCKIAGSKMTCSTHSLIAPFEIGPTMIRG